MRRLTFILSLTAVLAVLALSAAATASPSENSVVYWNRIAAQTILADSATATPSASSLYVAIVQAAVYDAVMAIERTYRPYAVSPAAPAGASEDAAVAAAAHDVLSAYFPAQQSSIETAYTDALAAIPDGQAKTDGIDVGQEVADAIVALRANDGRFAAVPQPPDGTEPGVWRRTSPGNAVTPWTAKVTPFLIKSPDQFRPGGPPKLTSKQYADELNEVRVLGASADYPGLQRTAGQTAIARFWSDNTIGQYNRALRGLAQERALSVGDSARLFAMTALTGADAMIGCWDTKYHYLGWRPITAIREADTDGNPRTDGRARVEPVLHDGQPPAVRERARVPDRCDDPLAEDVPAHQADRLHHGLDLRGGRSAAHVRDGQGPARRGRERPDLRRRPLPERRHGRHEARRRGRQVRACPLLQEGLTPREGALT